MATLLQALWGQGFLNGQPQTALSITVGPVEVEGNILPGVRYCFTSTLLSWASGICCVALYISKS